MMKTWLLLLFLMMPTIGAAVETVPVRSGEHDGFSRLVIHLPNRSDWTLTGDGLERSLDVDQADITFTTGAVFSRLTQGRITSVRQAKGRATLQLSLGCACDVVAFWAGKSMLVVDVSDSNDGDAQTAMSAEQSTREASDLPLESEVGSLLPGSIMRTPLVAHHNSTFPMATDLVAAGLSRRFSDSNQTGQGNGGPDDGSQPLPPDVIHQQTDLGEVRDTLVRQIGRAATQGLLTPVPGGPQANPSTTPTDHSTQSEHTQDQAGRAVASGSESPPRPANFSAQTSMDQGVAHKSDPETLSLLGETCPAEGAYQMTRWATDAAFSNQIGPLRTALAKERNRLDEATALRLARVYVYFGFGAEALQVLAMINLKSQDARVTRELAEIMEFGHLNDASHLQSFLHCDTDAAFWSALSFAVIPSGTRLAEDAILRTFNALPRHLREYLGPVLARRLLLAKHPQLADKILRILSRDRHDGTPAEQMAIAEVDLHDDKMGEADRRLGEVVDGNSDLSAEALLHRIDTRLASGRGIPEDMAELAGAYAVELRHQPIGHELARAYLQAMAATGNFDMAFIELARLTPDLTTEDHARVLNTILGLMVQNAEDVVFINYALVFATDKQAKIAPAVSNRIAQRLLQLGFPAIANHFVGDVASGTEGEDRRRIRAELALAQGRPRQAEVELLGLDATMDNAIRARARSMVGEHTTAQTLFQSSGQDEAAIREAVHAGDWRKLAQSEVPQAVDIAELMLQSEQATLPHADAPIANGRALLDASARSRDTLEAFLSSQPVPE